MANMKKLWIFLVGLLLAEPVFSQDENAQKSTAPDDKMYRNEIGLNLGYSTGFGISYRRWAQKFGFQITCMPYKTPDLLLVSAAFAGMYTLKRTQKVRTYLYVSTHFALTGSKTNSTSPTGTTVKSDFEYDKMTVCGTGLGFSFGRMVAFHLAFGYAAYSTYYYDSHSEFALLPTAELGLHYQF